MAWYRIGDTPLSEPILTRFTDGYMRHWGRWGKSNFIIRKLVDGISVNLVLLQIYVITVMTNKFKDMHIKNEICHIFVCYHIFNFPEWTIYF